MADRRAARSTAKNSHHPLGLGLGLGVRVRVRSTEAPRLPMLRIRVRVRVRCFVVAGDMRGSLSTMQKEVRARVRSLLRVTVRVRSLPLG